MNNGSMIAVWGSGDSGKTTMAVKLASMLADMKKEVIVVMSDISAPDMKVILPHEKDTRSMGEIWSMPECSVDDIYKSCVVTKSDYICLLGYQNGENVFSNPDYTKENIMNVLMMLKSMVDYVIVDCVSEFAYNVLTTVALELADHVIRLGEATPKSFSFFDANLALLMDSRYKRDQHIKILSKVKSYQAREAAISHFGGVQMVLPFIEEIEYQMLAGDLFNIEINKSNRAYYSGLNKIIQMITKEENAYQKQRIKSKEKAGTKKSTQRVVIQKDKTIHKKAVFKLCRRGVS